MAKATKEETDKCINGQTEITDLYQELTYSELKSVLEGWLNPSANGDEDTSTAAAETLSSTAKNEEAPFDVDVKSAPKAETSAKKVDDVASAFDDLFNS